MGLRYDVTAPCSTAAVLHRYFYDWKGRRVRKEVLGVTTFYFVYSASDELMAEYAQTADGKAGPTHEYDYLAGRPIAMSRPGRLEGDALAGGGGGGGGGACNGGACAVAPRPAGGARGMGSGDRGPLGMILLSLLALFAGIFARRRISAAGSGAPSDRWQPTRRGQGSALQAEQVLLGPGRTGPSRAGRAPAGRGPSGRPSRRLRIRAGVSRRLTPTQSPLAPLLASFPCVFSIRKVAYQAFDYYVANLVSLGLTDATGFVVPGGPVTDPTPP